MIKHIGLMVILMALGSKVAANFSVPLVSSTNDTIKVVLVAPDEKVYPFILDTGASFTVMGYTAFETSIKPIPGVYQIGTAIARLGNGSTTIMNVYKIPFLKFSNDCVVYDVTVAVNSANELNMVGMSVFKKISPVTFDIDNGVLSGGRCG